MSQAYISEIHELLNIGGPAQPEHVEHAVEAEHVPASLPTVEHVISAPVTNSTAQKTNWKAFLIYPAVFLIAFVFFFTILNFSSVAAQVEGFFTPPQSQQILGSDSAAYYKWISNYFYAVGDAKLLDPTNDIDKDGLTNYDEFILKTNPIVADSDNDGFSDGIEVINGTNPWGTGAMSRAQKDLVGKLDVIMINNRISYNVSTTHTAIVADSVSSNYDLTRPGTLSIPKLKLQVSLIWPSDPSQFDTDLTKGVIHYPGTALPGENGVIYVSGHSSDYIWKHDPMQNVFTKLNFLAPGDDVFIDVYGKDGKVYNFRYQVAGNHIYKPDDQAQFFNNTNDSQLNLSTCWPIGTSKDRIVVTAVPVAL